MLANIFERLYPKDQNFSLDQVINLLENQPKIAEINAKYVEPTVSEAYWNTLAYIDDLHDDLVELIEESKLSNTNKEYFDATKKYTEVLHVVEKLRKRSKFLQKMA